MSYKQHLKSILIGLTVLSLSSVAFAATPKMEKCSGIVKAGKADGQAVVDGKKVDWILVPAGACEKLVDGLVVSE